MMAFFETPAFCIITGGSKGLGREIAIQLAKEWHASGTTADIVLLSRDVPGMETTKSLIANQAPTVGVHHVQADLGALDSLSEVFAAALMHASSEKHKQAVLIHNAGTLGDMSKPIVENRDPHVIQDYLAVNLTSVFMLSALFLSRFTSGSRTVIEITSILSKRFIPSAALYSTGKAARVAFMGSLAVENPEVRVLSYSPGPCDTDMFHSIRKISFSEETRQKFEEYSKTVLSCSQSISKLVQILRENSFQNGSVIDYFDCV